MAAWGREGGKAGGREVRREVFQCKRGCRHRDLRLLHCFVSSVKYEKRIKKVDALKGGLWRM